MKQPLTPPQALDRLKDLCSRSEQCRADMLKRLRNWQISPDAAAEIIRELEEERYVDDSRFARAFVGDKYRFAGWGRTKIRAALSMRRIPAAIVDDALSVIDSAEYQRLAFRAMKSKLASLDRSDINLCRQKLLRFAASRGYESSLAIRILNSRSLWV